MREKEEKEYEGRQIKESEVEGKRLGRKPKLVSEDDDDDEDKDEEGDDEAPKFPPRVGAFIAYELFVDGAPRCWQLGRVASVRDRDKSVLVDLYGCRRGDFIKSQYFKARYDHDHLKKGEAAWDIRNDQDADQLLVSWSKVFLSNIRLSDKHCLSSSTQRRIQEHLRTCRKCLKIKPKQDPR